MMNFIYGVLTTWFLLGLGYSFWWGDHNFYTLLMEIPGGIIQILVEVICFPFIWFYKVFLRHTIHPVSFEVLAVKKIVADSTRIFGNVYFCHDKKEMKMLHQVFEKAIQDYTMQKNAPAAASDPLAPIKQLSELRDAGVISEKEFEEKKAALLSRIGR